MRFLSLFSGIEAASVALEPLGWTAVAFAEIEPAPCAILEARYPDVPNLGDVTMITDERIAALGAIDVVIGGSPCQDLSVAGNRAGLAGARSSLFHEQVRIFHAARALCDARWLWWENVPGAFSTHGGRDFACVVGAMAGCTIDVPRDGWGTEGAAVGPDGLVEWCVLDAQWFGLAQRRKRVFVVLDTGDWANRPPVLLEPESLRGDSAPRREAGQGVAGSITRRVDRGGVNSEGGDNHLIPERARALTTSNQRIDAETETLIPLVAFAQNQRDEVREVRVAGAIGSIRRGDAKNETLLAFDPQGAGTQTTLGASEHGTGSLGTTKIPGIATGMSVRRLTPRECERLMGFPDDWTLVEYRGKPMADGPRYRALGNSMAVPVIRWIGQQIQRAHAARLVRDCEVA